MNYEVLPNRKCRNCEAYKNPRAFVGFRDICRNCWVGLSEEEKRANILNERTLFLRKHRRTISLISALHRNSQAT